ncbi:hypothetical protein GH714_032213 [Hevea brasiliensis]|uniref:Pentacotripeptide-repeat region of PRORP domain-containing protein n=1 Tax=Hevea brasiliensis TaxID=3981 RepID=A0A6A6N8R7_HEVBR|nr:hypothetical protein GH714_032213 [Hevea brasiliensis]
MKLAGFSPDKVTYNALLDVYGKSRRPKEAMEVLREMESNGFSPSIVTYNSLIALYIVTWNTLLAVFGQNGMDSEVSGVFKEMKRAGRMLEAGVAPDLSSYNAVLAALARGGLWEQSEKIFTEMKDVCCKPNELTYCSLLHAYANGKEIERMRALAKEIYSGVTEPVAVLLKTLVLVNSKCDLLMETEHAFMELRKKAHLT